MSLGTVFVCLLSGEAAVVIAATASSDRIVNAVLFILFSFPVVVFGLFLFSDAAFWVLGSAHPEARANGIGRRF
jgi:hypothetical protein